MISPSCRLLLTTFFLSHWNFCPVSLIRQTSCLSFVLLLPQLSRRFWGPVAVRMVTHLAFRVSSSVFPRLFYKILHYRLFGGFKLLFVVTYAGSSSCLRVILFESLDVDLCGSPEVSGFCLLDPSPFCLRWVVFGASGTRLFKFHKSLCWRSVLGMQLVLKVFYFLFNSLRLQLFLTLLSSDRLDGMLFMISLRKTTFTFYNLFFSFGVLLYFGTHFHWCSHLYFPSVTHTWKTNIG